MTPQSLPSPALTTPTAATGCTPSSTGTTTVTR